MLDLKKVRDFYFNPPKNPEKYFPSREEAYALAERRAVEACILTGGDPEKEGLGEHGALIGGPGKPPRHFTVDPEWQAPARIPLPLACFDHPQAHTLPSPPPDDPSRFFAHLSAAHLAGYPNRPNGAALARTFRKTRMTALEQLHVRDVFTCIDLWDLPGLLCAGGMSVHQVARAIHLSNTRRQDVIAWINLFGIPPPSAPDSGG